MNRFRIEMQQTEEVRCAYERLINQLDHIELREIRTEDYWIERDKVKTVIGKQQFTIKRIAKWKKKKRENGIPT